MSSLESQIDKSPVLQNNTAFNITLEQFGLYQTINVIITHNNLSLTYYFLRVMLKKYN